MFFCVPGSVYNPLHSGTNRLLADGFAKVALGGKDILRDIAFGVDFDSLQQSIQKASQQLAFVNDMSPEQNEIYNCFTGQTLSVNQIFQTTEIPMAKLKAILSEMELLGYIKSEAPGIYFKTYIYYLSFYL